MKLSFFLENHGQDILAQDQNLCQALLYSESRQFWTSEANFRSLILASVNEAEFLLETRGEANFVQDQNLYQAWLISERRQFWISVARAYS